MAYMSPRVLLNEANQLVLHLCITVSYQRASVLCFACRALRQEVTLTLLQHSVRSRAYKNISVVRRTPTRPTPSDNKSLIHRLSF